MVCLWLSMELDIGRTTAAMAFDGGSGNDQDRIDISAQHTTATRARSRRSAQRYAVAMLISLLTTHLKGLREDEGTAVVLVEPIILRAPCGTRVWIRLEARIIEADNRNISVSNGRYQNLSTVIQCGKSGKMRCQLI